MNPSLLIASALLFAAIPAAQDASKSAAPSDGEKACRVVKVQKVADGATCQARAVPVAAERATCSQDGAAKAAVVSKAPAACAAAVAACSQEGAATVAGLAACCEGAAATCEGAAAATPVALLVDGTDEVQALLEKACAALANAQGTCQELAAVELAAVELDRALAADIAQVVKGAQTVVLEAAQLAGATDEPAEILAALAQLGYAGDERGYLGIRMNQDEGGMTVEGVLPGSGAAQAGLRAGDRILSIDGRSTTDEGLIEFLTGLEAGDSVEVRYERDGDRGRAKVRLMTLEAVQAGGEGESEEEHEHGEAEEHGEARGLIKVEPAIEWVEGEAGEVAIVEVEESGGEPQVFTIKIGDETIEVGELEGIHFEVDTDFTLDETDVQDFRVLRDKIKAKVEKGLGKVTFGIAIGDDEGEPRVWHFEGLGEEIQKEIEKALKEVKIELGEVGGNVWFGKSGDTRVRFGDEWQEVVKDAMKNVRIHTRHGDEGGNVLFVGPEGGRVIELKSGDGGHGIVFEVDVDLDDDDVQIHRSGKVVIKRITDDGEEEIEEYTFGDDDELPGHVRELLDDHGRFRIFTRRGGDGRGRTLRRRIRFGDDDGGVFFFDDDDDDDDDDGDDDDRFGFFFSGDDDDDDDDDEHVIRRFRFGGDDREIFVLRRGDDDDDDDERRTRRFRFGDDASGIFVMRGDDDDDDDGGRDVFRAAPRGRFEFDSEGLRRRIQERVRRSVPRRTRVLHEADEAHDRAGEPDLIGELQAEIAELQKRIQELEVALQRLNRRRR